MKSILFTIAMSLTLAACGGGGIDGAINRAFSDNCDSVISSLTKDMGPVEEVQRYDSADYHTLTYWYWSKGFSRTFTWSDSISCQTSDFTFSPIR